MTNTILFLGANPSDTRRLALDEEARAIRMNLRMSGLRHLFNFETRWAVRPEDLLQILNEVRPTILHVSSHGHYSGIALHGQPDKKQMVKADALSEALAAVSIGIRLVMLNACFSQLQGRHFAAVVDFFVGMSDAIHDESARVFSSAFYRALAFGASVQSAFDQGCAAIALQSLPGRDVPRLVCRDGLDPGSVILASATEEECLPLAQACTMFCIDMMRLLAVLNSAQHRPADASRYDEFVAVANARLSDFESCAQSFGTQLPATVQHKLRILQRRFKSMLLRLEHGRGTIGGQAVWSNMLPTLELAHELALTIAPTSYAAVVARVNERVDVGPEYVAAPTQDNLFTARLSMQTEYLTLRDSHLRSIAHDFDFELAFGYFAIDRMLLALHATAVN